MSDRLFLGILILAAEFGLTILIIAVKTEIIREIRRNNSNDSLTQGGQQ